eukprot:CAMPEP_0182557680 /NCGR_PEP_ID=MMETSP1324-20130603/1507_1 /TAXON_ID=236786 /ORGANISM="Florenciella sp., Strain RCC1587" /LENGTH=31 /DNA_ID= /DNA_START= /DNA_END= /DNA_ORIENTATION=
MKARSGYRELWLAGLSYGWRDQGRGAAPPKE